MQNEELILKIQAMVDNELPPEEIPDIMAKIEGNYRLREEYISLLQLKYKMAKVPFPKPPITWYENFERRRRNKVFMALGTASYLGATLLGGLLSFMKKLSNGAPDWMQPTALVLLGLGTIFFIIHTAWYKMEETKGKSYKEIIR